MHYGEGTASIFCYFSHPKKVDGAWWENYGNLSISQANIVESIIVGRKLRLI
jgi:hypothetical protein